MKLVAIFVLYFKLLVQCIWRLLCHGFWLKLPSNLQVNCSISYLYLDLVHFQVWGIVLGRGPQSSSPWPIRATSAAGPLKWWVYHCDSPLPCGIKGRIFTHSLFTCILCIQNQHVLVLSLQWCDFVLNQLTTFEVCGRLNKRNCIRTLLCIDRKHTHSFTHCVVLTIQQNTLFPHVLHAWVVLFPFFFNS